jgi:hypothetical protein
MPLLVYILVVSPRIGRLPLSEPSLEPQVYTYLSTYSLRMDSLDPLRLTRINNQRKKGYLIASILYLASDPPCSTVWSAVNLSGCVLVHLETFTSF